MVWWKSCEKCDKRNKLKLYYSKHDSFFILLIIFFTSQSFLTSGTTRKHPVLKSIRSYVNIWKRERNKRRVTRSWWKGQCFLQAFIETLQDPRKRMVSIFLYHCRSGFCFFLGGMLIWLVDHQKGICFLKLEQSSKYFFSPEIFPKHANSVDVSIRFSEFMVNDNVNDGVEYVSNKLNLN